jgi:hypothetical protein
MRIATRRWGVSDEQDDFHEPLVPFEFGTAMTQPSELVTALFAPVVLVGKPAKAYPLLPTERSWVLSVNPGSCNLSRWKRRGIRR